VPDRPHLGDVRLEALKPADIQALYARLLQAGYAPATVQLAAAILHRVLRQAVEWGLIPLNPGDRATPPKPERKEFRALSPAELSRLLKTARTEAPEYYPMFAVLALTGMQVSEAVGLRWQDVDLEAGAIRVSPDPALRRRPLGRGRAEVDGGPAADTHPAPAGGPA
jgi:integrase